MKKIIEQINTISEDIEIKSSEMAGLTEDVKKSKEILMASEVYSNVCYADKKLKEQQRNIENLKSLRESLVVELLSGCKHNLLYDYGYYKKVCGKQKIITSKENATHRNLRCICCCEFIEADRSSDYFFSDENVIAKSGEDFSELHELYMDELLGISKKYKR